MPKVEVLAVEEAEEDVIEEQEVAEDAETEEGEEQAEAEQPGIVVQIGDEEPEQADDDDFYDADGRKKGLPQWVQDMRKSHRERDKRIKELERKLGEREPAEDKPATLGPKPTRADCDFDDEEYDRRLEAWYEQKRQIDAEEQRRKDQQTAQEQAWAGKMTRYGEAKQKLGVRDYDDAETLVTDTLSITQQGIIVQGAENPALVTYALGKNPTRTKELARIEDPIEFAFAVAKLEAQLKVTDRKAPPPPEKTVRGSTGSSPSSDATLDKLRAEAAKSGDYSKVIRYKRERAGK